MGCDQRERERWQPICLKEERDCISKCVILLGGVINRTNQIVRLLDNSSNISVLDFPKLTNKPALSFSLGAMIWNLDIVVLSLEKVHPANRLHEGKVYFSTPPCLARFPRSASVFPSSSPLHPPFLGAMYSDYICVSYPYD